MKNIWLVLAIGIFLISLTSAEVQSLGTFKQFDNINLVQTCTNSTYSNITSVLYPDSTFALNGEYVMTPTGDGYNYTFTKSTEIGTYIVYGHCNEDNVDTSWAYDFKITASGLTGTLGFYFLVLILSLGIIIIGFYIQDNWIIALGGFGLIFIGLYILFYGIADFKDPVYTYGIGIITLMLGVYFSIRATLEEIK